MRPSVRIAGQLKLTLALLAVATGLGCHESTPTSSLSSSEAVEPSHRSVDHADYELVTLDLGGLEGFATDINNKNAVVGGVFRNGTFEAFAWRRGKVQFLGTLGGNFSFAEAINEVGSVTGTSTTESGEFHAFIWRPERGMEDLGAGEGRGINNAEVVVGVSGSTGFRWTATQGMVALSPLPGDYGSRAVDVNNRGVVVGSSVGPTGVHAVRWLESGSAPHDLGTVGGSHSEASGIADNGVIVGWSSTATYITPFRWTLQTGMQRLADPGVGGQAFDVSLAGAVGHISPFNPLTPVQPTQCFWPPDGRCVQIPTSTATLMAVNDLGVIAGALATPGPYGFAAVVWRPVKRGP